MATISDTNKQQTAVRGIRFLSDAEDERFMRFFGVVQDAAASMGKVFFLWTEEGNPLMTDELDGGDLSGWLVDDADADRFDQIWREQPLDLPEDLDDTFSIARWSQGEDGRISIEFT